MTVYKIYQVDSFTKEVLSGNPAGVVTNAEGLDEGTMVRIARELNNSETAFIFPGKKDKYDVFVRFFTPVCEVPICGHATIAAHYVRAREMSLPSCRVMHRTGAGILPVDIVFENNDYTIVMTQGDIEFGEILNDNISDRLARALRIQPRDFVSDYPIQIVSTGHSKVMVPIRSRQLLHSLTPDFQALTDISQSIACNGFYTFVTDSNDSECFVHGRMFAPAIGINEDPVTGNANGPLGAYLVKYRIGEAEKGQYVFTAKQGEAMRRPGTIKVYVTVENGEPVLVRIAGEAVVAFQAEMTI
ncbi:MAG: PhzF family isomerase [Defluviitaleaceae bacterium]|nr:PhzF family isomerase [Defluviitaleaceae bacterium]